MVSIGDLGRDFGLLLFDSLYMGMPHAVADGDHFLLNIVGGMIPLVLLLLMKTPIFVKVPARVQSTKA
jgi:hypothetical protein